VTRKNLVWLVFDSLRGDRTSIGGYDRETTPTLSAMGAGDDGVAGTCFSHAIWSQPSVASMMTGTYLSTHGSGSYNDALPEDIPTVAERLSEVGYRTVGVSGNPYFSPTTGTDRGFDRFDFVSGAELPRAAGPASVVSFLRNLRRYSGGFTLDRQRHTPDFLLNEIVEHRLAAAAEGDSPVFLAAHYYGLHHPYYPSPAFRGEFADDLPMSSGEAAELAFERSKDVYERIAGDGNSDAEQAAIDAMYDAQVRQVDALVGRLLSFLDDLGIGDETVVVVTSDHGDLLGELGLVSHKLLLHDALINVPVAVRGSDALAGVDLGLAQHADVMQTILAELGADVEGMQGVRLDESTRDMAVAQRGPETYEKTLDAVREHTPEFEHDHALAGFATALRTAEWKYVAGDEERVLYRLPDESEDVSAENLDVVKRFERRLSEWRETHDRDLQSGERAEFDDDVKRQLADLGYVVD
jgi:arylsulfatase A-like enzyme